MVYRIIAFSDSFSIKPLLHERSPSSRLAFLPENPLPRSVSSVLIEPAFHHTDIICMLRAFHGSCKFCEHNVQMKTRWMLTLLTSINTKQKRHIGVICISRTIFQCLFQYGWDFGQFPIGAPWGFMQLHEFYDVLGFMRSKNHNSAWSPTHCHGSRFGHCPIRAP